MTLTNVTQLVKDVNRFIRYSSKFDITDAELESLIRFHESLKTFWARLVERHEALIWTRYYKRARALSAAISALGDVIFRVRDKKGLIKTVDMPDLMLSEDAMRRLSEEAARHMEKYR